MTRAATGHTKGSASDAEPSTTPGCHSNWDGGTRNVA